ncbi:MAG: glycosyltransferase [Bacteroidetes bacterium]|nr:glycosyltransferase [Bacteroidota bacterium]
MKIAILGTRGIPASYSGFETSVQETATRFVRMGIETTVYCRAGHYREKTDDFHGVKLIYLPAWKSKHLETITNTFISVIHVLMNPQNAVILYGVGNSVFIPLLRLFSIPVVSVVDGADWERKKWGKLAKSFLKASRYLAASFSNFYVVDNELLATDYKKKFKRPPFYIPYGCSTVHTNKPEALRTYGLEERGYIIFVGRFVKEKGIDFLIRNYEEINTEVKLVIVGGNTTERDYVERLKMTADKRIIFTGFVYGEEYESLLHQALFYVSASFLEGTSPSLLAAMAINGFALVSNLPENMEVLKGTCATFRSGDPEDFKAKLSYYLSHRDGIEAQRETTRKVVSSTYDWDAISKGYVDLLVMATSQSSVQ